MKSKFWSILFLFLPIIGYTQGISFSIGGVYGINFQHPGLNTRIYYLANENICFGAEFSYFIPKKEFSNSHETTTFLSEFNFNFHYIFEVNHYLGLYPLVGYNYSVETERILDNKGQNEVEIKQASGINFGAGFHVTIGPISIFTEYSYVLRFGDINDHVISLGMFYALDFKKEKEKEHK